MNDLGNHIFRLLEFISVSNRNRIYKQIEFVNKPSFYK